MGAILTEQHQAADDMAQWAVETIPGLLVAELPGQDSRVARLLVQAAELRAERDKLRDLLHEQQRITSGQSEMIERLRDRIAEMNRAVDAEMSTHPHCTYVDLPLPGGAKAIVEAYYRPGTTPTEFDPGEGVECWAERVLIATKHGVRLVSAYDLAQALQDDGAVLRAVEAA